MARQRSARMIADEIASKVLTTFDALPTRYKPRQLPDGRREWVPLAGIVLSRVGSHGLADHSSTAQTQCVSLATGMKCLPRDKVHLARGNVIHDWHAEILVIRAFNRFILDECKALNEGRSSIWLQRREPTPGYSQSHVQSTPPSRPFALRPDAEVCMYISAAPCGDASMELTMASQEDAAPWTAPAPSAKPGDMIGRGHFDQLGVVRRKPSRPDAPGTWSKSCSDKLALKQCTGILSGLVSLLVEPIYLDKLILPADQIKATAVERAFGEHGRMALLSDEDVRLRWSTYGLIFKPFEVVGTHLPFAYAKAPDSQSSNLACMWTPSRQEALVNGVLMGRKQFDVRGASSVSRRRMSTDVVAMLKAVGRHARDGGDAHEVSYAELKSGSASRGRTCVKQDVKTLSLHNWRMNDGDEDWLVDSTDIKD